jgi:hypothetical protein
MASQLLIALTLVFVGMVLIRSARQSLSAGEAVTDENDLIGKRQHPVRFTLFVTAQLVFGCIFLVAGLAIGAALFYFPRS